VYPCIEQGASQDDMFQVSIECQLILGGHAAGLDPVDQLVPGLTRPPEPHLNVLHPPAHVNIGLHPLTQFNGLIHHILNCVLVPKGLINLRQGYQTDHLVHNISHQRAIFDSLQQITFSGC